MFTRNELLAKIFAIYRLRQPELEKLIELDGTWLQKTITPLPLPKPEKTIDKEVEILEALSEAFISFRKANGAKLGARDCKLLSLSLRYHERRLESILDWWNVYATILPFFATLTIVLAEKVQPYYWVLVVVSVPLLVWIAHKRMKLINKAREYSEIRMLVNFDYGKPT